MSKGDAETRATPSREEIKAAAAALTRKLADAGKIIEGGWYGFDMLVIPKDAPEVQRKEMRLAFFAGAQHLFTSIMNVLDSDREPTADDLRRMDLIHRELEAWAERFKMERTQ